MKNTLGLLQKLDISEKEFELYKKLLQVGPSTIMELSKFLTLPRTTIHQMVERLINKGIIFQKIKGNRRKIEAEEPEKLNLLLIHKENEAKKELEQINSFSKELKTLVQSLNSSKNLKDVPATDLKLYEGIQSITNVYREMFSSKELRSYANANWVYELVPEVSKLFIKEIKSKRLEDWDLMLNTSASRELIEECGRLSNYHYKHLPYDLNLEGIDYSIYDNKIGIIQNNMVPTAIIIENEFLYKNAKAMFDLMWSLLP